MPSLDELKALGAALPPSERLQASETADVLSAVVAVIAHGDDVVAAAKEGGDAVYAFYHEQARVAAQEQGTDEPQRGYQHAAPAPVGPATAVGSQQLDYDALAAAIVRAQRNADVPESASDVDAGQTQPARPDSAPTTDVTAAGPEPQTAPYDEPEAAA